MSPAPVVIEVRGVEKTFRLPLHRVDSIKERATHPFTRMEYRELRALREVSFDVRQGEFFGIVGRNGSGKSSLLKVMASIYRADSGRIRMAGRLAPFIELGVGFNPELSARENVLLNGVMMGLTRQEAARRLDAVLEFAELEEFVELKLKNYSSGMMVRLAFAVMVQADADIMLIDEVLAVGDASFAQKCMDVFRERREAGKTIVLVTHDMATVQAMCHRAMLLHDGELVYIGEAEEAALRYYRLNFGSADSADHSGELRGVPDVHARVIDSWLEDGESRRVENVEQGTPIKLMLTVEARRDLVGLVFGVHVLTAEGTRVFGFNQELGAGERIGEGQRVRVSARMNNPLLPGRYYIESWIARDATENQIALQHVRLVDFMVYGTRPGPGIVAVDAEASATVEPLP